MGITNEFLFYLRSRQAQSEANTGVVLFLTERLIQLCNITMKRVWATLE